MEEEKRVEDEDLKPRPPARLAPRGIRTFTMCRQNDETGISGTGVIVEGVLLATGQVILHWLSPSPRGTIAIFDSMNDFVSIHITSHPVNGTILTFEDGEQITYNIDGTKDNKLPENKEEE